MRPDSVATRPHLYSKENYLDICTASTQFLKLPVQGFFELFNAATFQQHVPVGTLWLGLRKVRCFAVNAQGFFPGFCRPRIRYISLSSESHNYRFAIFRAILDRKSTRLNSSHVAISYAVFCMKNLNA